MEILGPNRRSDVGAIPSMGWPCGIALIAWVAYWLKSFRYMQLLNVAMILFCIICFYWFDESPRWQIAKGHFDKAEKTIKKAMKINGKSEDRFNEKMNQLKDSVLDVRI